jgi:glycosyltransferase involved in cell wall biosynthesis
LVPRKGQKIVLEAMPALLAGGLDVQCLLLGDAPDYTDSAGVASAYANELRVLARQPLLRDRVTLLPHRDDIRAVLAASDGVVVPSLAEPFGIVILEAFASGVPVVASSVAGPLELIEDGETGILVSPGQPHALADGIRRLSTDVELRDHVSTKAREQVKTYFSEDVFTARVRAIYSSVLRRETAVCDRRTAT